MRFQPAFENAESAFLFFPHCGIFVLFLHSAESSSRFCEICGRVGNEMLRTRQMLVTIMWVQSDKKTMELQSRASPPKAVRPVFKLDRVSRRLASIVSCADLVVYFVWSISSWNFADSASRLPRRPCRTTVRDPKRAPQKESQTSGHGETIQPNGLKTSLSTVWSFCDGAPNRSLDLDRHLGDFVNHLWADGFPFQWALDCISGTAYQKLESHPVGHRSGCGVTERLGAL